MKEAKLLQRPFTVVPLPTENFGESSTPEEANFLRLLEEEGNVQIAFATASDIHKGVRRLAKDTPYMSHVVETAFISYKFCSRFSESGINPEMAAARGLLHDTVEMHPLNHHRRSLLKGPGLEYTGASLAYDLTNRGMDKETAITLGQAASAELPLLDADTDIVASYDHEIAKVIGLSDFRSESLSEKDIGWLRRKRADMIRILGNSETQAVDKISDVIANAADTLRDVQYGINGRNSGDLPSPEMRLRMFTERLLIIAHCVHTENRWPVSRTLLDAMLVDLSYKLTNLGLALDRDPS